MREIGKQLLDDSRAAILAEHSGKVEKDSWQARDLLSLLLKANMATDLQPKQRMSDEDVLARPSHTSIQIISPNETQRYRRSWSRVMKRRGTAFASYISPTSPFTVRQPHGHCLRLLRNPPSRQS